VSALITLTEHQVADAAALAEATHERWQAAAGHYRNTVSSHRKGKLGEIAVEEWAAQNGLEAESFFRDPNMERYSDIQLGQQRFDVKTWDARYWEAMGRCVRPGQLSALRRKADGLVWCFVDESLDQVVLAGWSTVEEVSNLPVVETGPSGRKLANHQVPLDGMRSMDDLLAAIA
jgi:hypothetical protein